MNVSRAVKVDKDRRKWKRIPLAAEKDVTVHVGSESFPSSIVDLSIGGAKLALTKGAACDGDVAIDHGSLGRLSATCVWQTDTELGLQFSDADIEQNFRTAHSCP